MKVLVIGNFHLIRTSDNKYYSPSVYSYDFFKRYLKVFDEVRLIGKVKHEKKIDEKKYLSVSGQRLEILELPWYQGMREMLKVLPRLIPIYLHASDDCDCCILRIAQVESFLFYLLSKRGKPFCVEVVNDPDTFVDMPFFMRKFSVYMTKKITKKADGAAYVTESFLQKKYPGKASLGFSEGFESYYSSIDLDEIDIQDTPINYNGGEFCIVHVSNAINSDLKGHTTLIKAFAEINKKNSRTKLLIIGDGCKLEKYKSLVSKFGLSENVEFAGRIKDKRDLFHRLRQCNLMILPTKMEGLPRTIIEAMAVGLPCLSSPTAGIPEILDEKYLFSPDDYISFAKKTLALITSPDELRMMSLRNIETSKKYCRSILDEKRTEFYCNLRDITTKKIYK